MDKPKYLIFTNKRDITSDFIVREMEKRSLSFYRLNTEDFASYSFIHNHRKPSRIFNEESCIDLKEVRSAYFRRPHPPEVSTDIEDNAVRLYAQDEWSYILRSVYLELDKKWFSHPNKIILAEDKLKQLNLASEVSFLIPETIVTNNKEALIPLFAGGSVVAKPLKHSLLEGYGEKGSIIFTSIIKSLSDINQFQLSLTPAIFQRKIEKKFDLRVTVVEECVFTVSINSQKYEATKIDWRYGSTVDLEHEIYDLPKDISEKCITLVRLLGLRFGAIDLILDTSGDYWFLECNPNGQWAWIENRTGLSISASIVDSMERAGL